MCVCFLLALVFSPGAIEGAAPIRRWAIVPSDNVQKTGMTDLLFARLAASGIELVEREELAKVTRELELPRYVGAGDASARLELGQKLKADALVLLSRKQRGEGDALEIVISETRSGARLYFDYFPYEPAKPKAMADACAEQTLRISRHFADGIVMLVAVPPLISRDLSHRLGRCSRAWHNIRGLRLWRSRRSKQSPLS
jgi:hypothetical protein